MFYRLEDLGKRITNQNKERRNKVASKTDQRLDAFNMMYEIIKNYPITPNSTKEKAHEIFNKVYKSLERFGRKPPEDILESIYKGK